MSRLRRRRINSNIVLNDQTRLFIRDKSNDCCCGEYVYHSCVSVGDLAQSRAARTKIYCPSPSKYSEFDVVADIKGEVADGSGSMATNYQLGSSALEKYFRDECLFDLQIHIGQCTDPSDFSQFEKAIILQDVEVTSYTLGNLFAKAASERGAVTESVEFTYFNMITLDAPEFKLESSSLLGDGPIIDSFTFCNSECCLCPNSSGRYLVQLVKCNDDCACGNTCAKARILYQTDCSTWRASTQPVCEGVSCQTLLNKNVILGVDGSFSYVHLNGNFGDSIANTLNNALVTIPSTALITGSQLRAAHGCDYNVVLAGDNGYIFHYDTVSKSYRQITGTTIPLTNINYCGVKFCEDDCNIVYLAADKGRVLKLDLSTDTATTYTLPDTTNQVHLVAPVGCCAFVASVNGVLYHSCNGVQKKSSGISGTVTALHAPNEFIVFAATLDGTTSAIWQSLDGGVSFTQVHSINKAGYTITSLSTCYDNPSVVTASGTLSVIEQTEAAAISCSTVYACAGLGFSLKAGGCP